MMYDFSKDKLPGPSTLEERLILSAIYAPYLIVPLLLLFTMLFSSEYGSGSAASRQNLAHIKPDHMKQKRNWATEVHAAIFLLIF